MEEVPSNQSRSSGSARIELELGVPAVLKVGSAAPAGDGGELTPIEFLLKHLGAKAAAKE